MTGYAKKFNENATMSFRANNKHLLKNFNEIWKKDFKDRFWKETCLRWWW